MCNLNNFYIFVCDSQQDWNSQRFLNTVSVLCVYILEFSISCASGVIGEPVALTPGGVLTRRVLPLPSPDQRAAAQQRA